MGKAKLTRKIIGALIEKGSSAPKGAITYDMAQGISKKGHFTIFSFKDKNGRLLQQESKYVNGSNVSETIRCYEYPTANSRIVHQYNPADPFNHTEERLFFDKKHKDAWMFKIDFGFMGDSHKISYLSPGKQAQNVSYTTFWDGEAPHKLVLTGTSDRKLRSKNLEYLPLIGDAGCHHSVKSRIEHTSAIQEKKFNLEGITPKAKRVPSEELNENAIGECNLYNGQVKVDENIGNSRQLLDTLGHEYKHAQEASLMQRLETNVDEFKTLSEAELNYLELGSPGAVKFNNLSIQKGIIPNNSRLGKKVKEIEDSWNDTLSWAERPQEIRAEQAATEEVKKLDYVIRSLKNLFKAKFWWES